MLKGHTVVTRQVELSLDSLLEYEWQCFSDWHAMCVQIPKRKEKKTAYRYLS